MGLTKEDRQILEKLVRYHLLLPDIATRRDLEDPVTLEDCRRAVGDETTLELLRVLTAADGEATGRRPGARGKRILSTSWLIGPPPSWLAGPSPRPAVPFGRPPSHDGGRRLAGLPSERELVVIAPDRPGLFSEWPGPWRCTTSAFSRPGPTAKTAWRWRCSPSTFWNTLTPVGNEWWRI